MKRLLIFLSAVIVIGIACSKSAGVGKDYPDTLLGKWRYVAYVYGTGGPVITEPANPLNQFVQFNSDGTITSNMSFFNKFTSYEIQDSVRIKFLPQQPSVAYPKYGYWIDTVEGTMSLGQLDPICIEGCSYKFKRY